MKQDVMEILLWKFLGPYNACDNNGYNDSGSSYGMLPLCCLL